MGNYADGKSTIAKVKVRQIEPQNYGRIFSWDLDADLNKDYTSIWKVQNGTLWASLE